MGLGAAGWGLRAGGARPQILSLLPGHLGWSGGFWDWVSSLDLNLIGFFIVGMFILTWAAALAIWRFGNIEDRWSRSLRGTAVAPRPDLGAPGGVDTASLEVIPQASETR